ncbi:transposase, partial [Periweissella beninensis]|nr:transposase [Periweissella beninensis]
SVKKQKYICPNCKKTAIASIDDVRPNDHIALWVKRAIASELTESISKKYISKRYFVSANTVQRASNMWFEDNNRFIWLPQHISFDDFKSGNFAKASMSIVLINRVDHRILDVIKDRANLKNYFNRYSLSARRAVKTITVDLFS